MAKTPGKQPKKQKHLPLRTCIACRETKPKRELLRVVRTPDGHVSVDATGKKSGRGAYISARLSCWQKALKEHRIERELEVTLSPEDQADILAFMDTLPKDEPVQAGDAQQTAASRPLQATTKQAKAETKS